MRLLRSWDRLDPDKGAWGLARAIALHAIADGARGRDRHQSLEAIDLRDASDLERAGIARFRLSSVRQALLQMTPTDRRVLLTEVGVVSPPALGRSAMKMARSRARQRLRALVERPGSWVASPLIYLRQKVNRERQAAYERRVLMYPHLAESAMAAIIALTMTFATIIGGGEGDTSLPMDGIQGGRSAGILLGITRGDGEVSDRLERISTFQALSPEHVSYSRNPAWNNDPLYARETAAQVQKDAEQLGKEAEFVAGLAQKEAQTLRKEAEFIVGLAQKDAQNLRKEAEFIVGLANDEVKRTRRVARELLR